jgi:hypothetical protein
LRQLGLPAFDQFQNACSQAHVGSRSLGFHRLVSPLRRRSGPRSNPDGVETRAARLAAIAQPVRSRDGPWTTGGLADREGGQRHLGRAWLQPVLARLLAVPGRAGKAARGERKSALPPRVSKRVRDLNP